MIPDHGQQHALSEEAKVPLANGGRVSPAIANRSLRDVCLELRDRVDAFLAQEPSTTLLKQVQQQVRISIGVVEEALTRYKSSELAISYNGGKDCLVLLILILACLARRPSTSETAPDFPETLQGVYVVAPHSFSQVDDFVESSSSVYRLDLSRFALPMRAALGAYLAERPSVGAVFVGTRRTDPHGANLGHFDPTDAGWPDFMRIHPVIDWHYVEIWAFIRQLGIPYCPLYDEGYTSLGGTLDTHPNPQLKREGENGAGRFRPAYELMDDDEERLGRDA